MNPELELLNDLRAAGVLLWAKGEDRLGFSVPQETGFPQPLKDRVSRSKRDLLRILELNRVDSEERARRTTHWKLPEAAHDRTLLSVQRGMYLQSRIDELGHTYTIPLFVELTGTDADAAERSVRALLAAEPILRMRVHEDLSYEVLPADAFTVARGSVTADRLDALREERARTAFPLPGGHLVHPEVIEVTGTGAVVVGLTHHHMLSDAYSADLLVHRLLTLHDTPTGGAPGDDGPAPDYFDLVAQQRIELAGPDCAAAREHLARRLAAAGAPRLGRRAARGADNRAATLRRTLDPDTHRALTDLAARHRLSRYALLFTGLYHTLSSFTGGQDDFPVALTVANRPPAFQLAIGPFVNTLPLIPEYRGDDTFLANARRVNDAVVDLNQHHQLNVDMLADALPGGAADLAGTLQVLFTLHNYTPVEAPPTSLGYRVLPYEDLAEKFGISVIAKEGDDRVDFTVTYAEARYEREQVEALLDTYLTVLRSAAATPDAVIDRLELVPPEALHRVAEWNATERDHGPVRTAVEMFERQARRSPDATAVVHAGRELTYRQLNERANRLAHLLLRRHGVAQGSLICLRLDRSEHMLVTVLGVLKAGCAYVPVDTDAPHERLRFILADTGSPLLLTDARNRAGCTRADPGVPVVTVDEDAEFEGQPCDDPGLPLTGSDLAYVIYTSGTTGRPKGVLCEHGGLVNRIQWMNRMFPLGPEDRVLQKTPYVFDVSVWELLWAVWYGAAVVFAEPGAHRDPYALIALIERERVTVLHFVPSMFAAFLEAADGAAGAPAALSGLRLVFCSGEELKPAQVRDAHRLLPGARLHNLYGPTEASIDVLHHPCTDPDPDTVPIGTPIDNTRVYVLNRARRPLPAHAIGELYLGGAGLARGYLNRPELTAERFVPDPFGAGRLYRTGDLVRQRSDGSIEFLGRDDFQVKIRGHRIELGEIEAALTRCPGVRQAVALVQQADPRHQYLVGYYVADHPLDEAALTRALRETLPPYMVPGALVHLAALPVTVNGKLDRRALPDPGAPRGTEERLLPRTPLEQRVRDLWADCLGLRPEDLGVRDDVTRLGMDSIVAIRVASRLRKELGVTIAVRDIFSLPTVEQVAALAVAESEAGAGVVTLAEQGVLSGEVPLLPVQEWFFGRGFARPGHWNQAFLIRVPELERGRLEAALRGLVERHDALRLRFREGVQFYDVGAGFPGLRVLDVRELPGGEGSAEFETALRGRLTDWQSGFDLERGPVAAFGYLHGYAEGGGRVFVALHHLVTDTVSWQILAEDLYALYEGRDLGPKGTSYRQWSQAVAEYGRQRPEETAYWENLLADFDGGIAGWSDTGTDHSEEFTLTEAATRDLLGPAHRAYHTRVDDLLLTALARALQAVAGGQVHHVAREGHGREDIAPGLDVSGTLGWFTTLHPVRLPLADDLGDSICAVKESLRAVPAGGIGYGPLLGHRPLPPVWFNYLGRLDAEHAGSADWRLVLEDGGETMPACNTTGALLTVLAHVGEGRLRVRLDGRLDAVTTRALADAFEAALTEVVAHCGARTAGRYTPSDFRDVRGEADLSALPPAPGADPGGWFDMTEIQKAYLVGRLGNYEIGNVANHVYSEYHYRYLDTDRLEESVNRLIAECDVLRTVFSAERLQQRVLDPTEVPRYEIPVHDHTDRDHDPARPSPVRERLSHHLYDPERFPLFTFEVSRFRDRSVLHVSWDLIALDVQSRLAVMRRLDDIHRDTGRRPPLPRAGFKDYQDYVGLLKHSRWYETDRAYWQDRLATLPLRCTLPFATPPDTVTHPRFAEHTLRVGPDVWDRFKEQARRHGVSTSSVLLALFGSVVSYFSGAGELPITLTLFHRLPVLEGTDALLGNFTSTVLHHHTDRGGDAETLTRRTHDLLWESIGHALYSGVEVQRDLSRLHGLDPTRAVSPIVFTGVVGQETRDVDRGAFLDDSELTAERHWSAQTSQAWIDLQAVEVADGFMSKWLYVEQLFDRDLIDHLNRLYCALIEHLANGDWAAGLPRDRYVPAEDLALVEAANATGGPVCEDTLFGLYESRLDDGRRDAVAVVDAATGRSHTYGELYEDSTTLARRLRGVLGDPTGDTTGDRLVAVLAEKGYAQVLASVAVMKAGRAYLPLHVDWPAGRIQDVLGQAGAGVVLVSRGQASRPEVAALGGVCRVLVVEDLLAGGVPEVVLPRVGPDDVAYVIFTSGSTGRPKGVTVSHRGAVNTLVAVNDRFGVGCSDRVLALSELSFDLSVYDLFGVLAAGGAIVFPVQGETKNPAHWLELVRRHGVTVWNSVPQLAGLLADEAGDVPGGLESLRAVLLSGDWIPTQLPGRLRRLAPGATVMSLGGATEGSVWSVWFEVGRVDPGWASIPYGTAMPGQRMYVLNGGGEHCPVGVVGEIHIGGAGVALGYWRDEERTAERFFEHPVLGRLYRTGDLGRWTRQGWIEFIGRNDFQVKLNGYRVELGEIESALTREPDITQSVVLVKEHDAGAGRAQQLLVAYYVSPEPLDAARLSDHLSACLPAYMVPEVFVHLPELPLSPNGKLDRNALPDPAPAPEDFVPPRGERERRLRDVWADVLGMPAEQLGITMDLMRLGMDSIVAIRLVSRIRREFGVRAGVRDVFEHRTVERFHDRVLAVAEPEAGAGVVTLAEQGVLSGEVPLLPVQEWFFGRGFARPGHWNQAFLIRVPELERGRLEAALRGLVERHDALRLRFREGVQFYDVGAGFPGLRMLDVRELPGGEGSAEFETALRGRLTDWQSGFDLEQGPVAAFGYLHGYAEGGGRVFVALHHLVTDTVSWQILAEDLYALYEGRDLGPKGTSYRQWSQAVAEYGRQRPEETAYWENLLADLDEAPVLRQDTGVSVDTEVTLDAHRTGQLLGDCRRVHGTRVDEFLLAAFTRALADLTGLPVQHLMVEGHGREDIAPGLDVSRTLGWFTTLHPVRVEVHDDPGRLLASVKDGLRAVPGKGLGHGPLYGYDRLLPRVCFNYLGRLDPGTGPWQVTGEPGGDWSHPDNLLPYIVTATGMVTAGQLRFTLSCRLPEPDARRLARAFEDRLTELVDTTARSTRTYLTVSDIDGLLPQEHLDRLQADRELDGVFAATSLQQGFIHHAVAQGDIDDAYRVQAVWDYDTTLDPDLYRAAWEHVQRSLATLRLRFDWQHEMVQVVDREAPLTWQYLDLSGHPDAAARDAAFQALLESDRATPYDLRHSGLFRVHLVKQGTDHFTCVLNTHHAILDGWSSPLLLRALHDAYLALREGRPVEPAADDYAAVQRGLRRHAHDHDAFWRAYVGDATDACDLSGLLRPEARGTDLAAHRRVLRQEQQTLPLSPELLARLRSVAQDHGVTLNALLQYAWHKVLGGYGRAATTVVGTVLAGRDLPIDGIETAVGLHLSTVPLIARHDTGADSVIEEVQRLQDDLHEISRRSVVDLAALQPGGRRLFDSLFIYENYPAVADEQHERLLRPRFRFRHQKRDYPLVVSVTERDGHVTLVLDHAGELFAPETALRLLTGVESVLDTVAGAPGTSPADLAPTGPDTARREAEWNDSGTAEPAEPVIHRAFEAQAARTPTAPVVTHGETTLTYAELNAAANRLARLVRQQVPLAPEEPVLLLLDRGTDTLTGLLAVLKAGCAYVPLDPGYPDERVARIAEGSGARLVLTQSRHRDRLSERFPGLTVLAVDAPQTRTACAAQRPDDLDLPTTGDALAYVLYTSGTTGQPKGVMVEHRAFTTTMAALRQRHFPEAGPLRTYSLTNYVFDIFGLEYGLTLLGGGSMVLGDHLVEELDCAGYDFVQMTPSLLEMKLPVLRGLTDTRLLIGGERLDRHLLRSALRHCPHVVNVYGPTETTIWSTSRAYTAADADGPLLVTIGRPLPNERAHVLDARLRPLPPGAIGELYLGGAALARGYLGDPELTRDRFVDASGAGLGRLYRTGDLARRLDDGEIEFVGRVDGQIKLRGHRIESGEIESALRSFPGVRQSAVIVGSLDGTAGTPDSARSLIGYYVADQALDEDALRGHLARLLPEYMRPAAVMHLTELPLTYSGKLDVRALPAPRRRAARTTAAAPSDDTERLLARLWQDVLGLDEVGVHDRFFDVGGNSVLLTKVHARLPEEIRRAVPLTDMFRLPTIASLAAHVTGRDTGERPRREPAVRPADAGHRDSGGGRDIAIIGMAGRFPDADDLAEFWHNLVTGHDSVVRPPREELLAAGVLDEELDQPGYVRAQSRLRDIRSFDAEFFGYSPREARTMDPQHRVFLECAWHALEDAHCDPATYQGDIGVYAGAGQNDYAQDHVLPSLGDPDLATRYQVMINNQANFLCTKVAYKLGLTGPAVTVQTACSTSLVAVHQACTALLAGDCDVALAGGVSIGKLRTEGYLHQEGMVFSPDGTCRAFDEAAQGTVEGQGVGIVVLKRLDRALADGDRVRAVIKATAINNDGRNKIGYTAPSQERQAAVIRTAHERAGIDPATVGYVEAHGTGTPLGDPIEVAALREAFAAAGTPCRVALGSVKTNIGHLDVASGIAGLIKTVLCLEHRTLVPTLHHTRPNPRLELEKTPFHVVTEVTAWSGDHPVLRAGVSSFGIGGTNAHVVLEEAPATPGPRTRHDVPDARTHTLFIVSAPAPDALDRQARALARHVADHADVPLEQLAGTLNTARHRFPYASVVVADGRRDLLDRLSGPQRDPVTHRPGRPVVLLFPGQGAQYRDMGRALYASEPGFRAHVDRCRDLLRGRTGADACEADLLGRTDRVGDTRFTHVALFVVEYALARWFTDLGVRPAAVIGHSLGAYAAACLAGVLTPKDALTLVAERGRLLAGTAPGAMLAVPLPEDRIRHRLDRHGLDLAAVNDATSCVVSGPAEAVDALTAELAAEGVTARRLAVSRAFHSRLLDPVLDRFATALEQVRLREPELPFVSDLTGDWADPGGVCRPAYWLAHLRRTVRFHDGLSTLYGDERLRDAVLLEVGPGRALGRAARRHPDRAGHLVVPALPPAGDAAHEEPATALRALGTAWAAGADIEAEAFHGPTARDRVPLPGYAFARQEHWIDRAAPAHTPARPAADEPPGPTAPRVLPDQGPDGAAPAVVEAWRTVLGVDTVRPDDDFFAQGGDSLAAVQLVARIRERTGIHVEFMALERHTPQALTEALAGQAAGSRPGGPGPRNLVVIRTGDPQARPPLVLVHPIGGDVYFYRDLAACLPDDQAVYALRSPLLDGTAHLDTIESMAACYLEQLEEFGLKPPYRLGGSSFGGLVAYEMAQQLDARDGHRPEVVLIDSPAPGNLPAEMTDDDIIDYLMRYGLARLDLPREELAAQPTVEDRIRLIADRARGTEFEDLLSADFLPRYLRTWQRHSRAMHAYTARPYSGDVLFFSHREEIPEFPAGQAPHWRRLARGGFRNVPVPGNHLSMNGMPHVATIGAHLAQGDNGE
ncbi:non-ribosomal peptide synthetase/type I polyketide synthase [Streptomyces afghaniensis]|uniref:non-ribosomal peptide synthetase/type I polyketide synthase n=1 Tax=Streptomyces afghaniensis TaxID=66865 RepID=UPI00278A0B63|nr:non-ribosomal peptide synthetase/type I polyketide synthase [Streptomyces afghaniensis]MDQ1015676.1 amino acid adenylation domain-containing protein/non-ribosomal peptide synthase protein (TIGR01720 family) [Streptomyces afghaniensis]